MANNINNTDLLSALPFELRQMIWDLVLGDSGLSVSLYGSRGRDPVVLRRVVSNGTPTADYPPHSLFYVSRLIRSDVRQLWQQTFNGRLQIDSRLTQFPPQMFQGVTHLSLSIAQAAEALQVTVPRLLPGYGYWYLPITQLVLPHAPSVHFLELHWDMPFFVDNPFDRSQRNIQAALIRLQYFQRSFHVTIHFRASQRSNQQLLATGTMQDNGNTNLQTSTIHFHGPMALRQQSQDNFRRELREFGWDLRHPFRDDEIHFAATFDAHPHHDFVPLGYYVPAVPNILNSIPMSSTFPTPNPFLPAFQVMQNHSVSARRRNLPVLQRDPPGRRPNPRPYDP